MFIWHKRKEKIQNMPVSVQDSAAKHCDCCHFVDGKAPFIALNVNRHDLVLCEKCFNDLVDQMSCFKRNGWHVRTNSIEITNEELSTEKCDHCLNTPGQGSLINTTFGHDGCLRSFVLCPSCFETLLIDMQRYQKQKGITPIEERKLYLFL